MGHFFNFISIFYHSSKSSPTTPRLTRSGSEQGLEESTVPLRYEITVTAVFSSRTTVVAVVPKNAYAWIYKHA